MRMSDPFHLPDFTHTDQHGMANDPGPTEIANLRAWFAAIGRPLLVLGPVDVLSGYRSRIVNVAVGGSKNSQHVDGKAVDLTVAGKTLKGVFNYIFETLPFDQLIYEFDRWIHASYDSAGGRKSALRARKAGGETVYFPQGKFA